MEGFSTHQELRLVPTGSLWGEGVRLRMVDVALGQEHSPTQCSRGKCTSLHPQALPCRALTFSVIRNSVYDNRIKHRYTPQLKIVTEGEEIPSSNQFRFHFTDLLQAKARNKTPQGIICLWGWKTNTLFRNCSQVNSSVYFVPNFAYFNCWYSRCQMVTPTQRKKEPPFSWTISFHH